MIQDKWRKTIALVGILVGVLLLAMGTTKLLSRTNVSENTEVNIVTSFYPIYLATNNIVADIEGVRVVNLMEQQQGCIHDYQLTPSDMKKLEEADIFIMNGAGMESYLETILNTYPHLTIIDSSVGTTVLDNEGAAHEHTTTDTKEDEHEEDVHEHEEDEHKHEDEEHNHGLDNSHIWISMNNYKVQLQNIAEGISDRYPLLRNELIENKERYQKEIEVVQKEYDQFRAANGEEVVIFHDAFAYLAKELGIDILYSVIVDGETSLNAGEIAKAIDIINEHQVKVIITEEQLNASIAERIAAETGATVYTIDSLVSGDKDNGAYLRGMRENLSVLKKAFAYKED